MATAKQLHIDPEEIRSELEEGFARMFTDEESHRTQQWIDWLDEVLLFGTCLSYGSIIKELFLQDYWLA